MRIAARRSSETRKLPAFVDMIKWLREKLYAGSDNSAEGLYAKGVYLAAAIAYDMGLRPGNVRKADGPNRENHCIQAGDLVFRVENNTVKEGLLGGEQVREYLGRRELEGWVVDEEKVNTVEEVGIRVVTSKTSGKVRAPIKAWALRRGNEHEESLLTDLCRFMVWSGVREDEPFCSRWAANKKGVMMRKTVTSQDLSKAVKEAAEAFGLPAENFSAKSLRSGFASQMSACGVER